ncbi:MAG TPA: hypothetical protein VG488_12815 [Candidatus Angelobacter sp.]|nr:hypothetical protein [Candidatus Angelobacter sp.]
MANQFVGGRGDLGVLKERARHKGAPCSGSAENTGHTKHAIKSADAVGLNSSP